MSAHVLDEIADFLEERLSASRMDEIRRHLETCESCATDLAFARDLRDRVIEQGLRHPSPERMLALGEGETPSVQERDHIARCQACRDELQWVRSRPPLDELPAEGEQPVPARVIEPARIGRPAHHFRWVWSAAAVAAAVLAIVVVRPTSRDTSLPSQRTLPPRPEPTRAGSLAPWAQIEPLRVRLTRGPAEPGSFADMRMMGLEAYQAGEYDSAIVHLSRALAMRPGDVEIGLYLGSAHLMRRQAAAAIPFLQDAADRAKSQAVMAEALWLLANARLMLEQGDEALQTLGRLRDLNAAHRGEADSLVLKLEARGPAR